MRSSGYSAQGEGLDIHAARREEHRALYEAFAKIVARGEGFPQDPGVALSYDDFSDYWLDHKSFVGVATVDGRLVPPEAQLRPGGRRTSPTPATSWSRACEATGLASGSSGTRWSRP